MAASVASLERTVTGLWPRLRRRVFRPWALVAFAVVTLGASELAVRAIDASRGYSPRARVAWYWLYEQDPLLGYRGRPSAWASIAPKGLPENADRIQHNRDGFHDPRSFEEIRALEDRRLVFCVGDANTYGLTAGSSAHTYPAELEKELRRLSGDERWVVYNAGLPGYTSQEILELIKLRLLKLRPDVIVSMSLVNDYEHVTRYLDDQLDYDFYPLRMAPLSATRVNDLLMRSSLVGRLAQRWRARFLDDLGGRWPLTAYGAATERGMKLYLDNVALMSALCSRSGVALMHVDQPIHYSACSYGPNQIQSVERMRVELRRTAAQAGVPVLSAQETFDWEGIQVRGDMLLASNESVLGPVGYERLAHVLAPQILQAYAASTVKD